jgi:tetratricopeptide (TPR) repeat protein
MVGASGPAERFATAVSILGRYILLLIAPVTLVFDYSYNTIPNVGLADFRFLLAFLVFGYALYYALKNTPLKKPMAFGILFFLGTVVLVSNLFLLIEATMAERFLYTPSYGFCLVAALLLGSLIKPAGKGKNSDTIPKGFIVPVGIVLALFSVRTIARNFDWKDNYTLLTKDVQSNPESARIRYAYGSALLFERAVKPEYAAQKTEYLNKAIEQLSKGVALIENYNDAWFHLGLAYKELENGPEAVKAFEKARSLKAFDEATKFSNSGIAYGMSGQYDKAVADLRVAITLEPDSSDHYNNLGLYLGDANRLNEAMGALDTAIILNSNNDKAYYNKGNVYAKAGDFRQAMINYAKTIELKPGSSDALNNTGNCYAAMQKPDSALIWFQKAAEADPTNRKAFTNLGVTYMILGDSVKGKEYMNRANAMNSGL